MSDIDNALEKMRGICAGIKQDMRDFADDVKAAKQSRGNTTVDKTAVTGLGPTRIIPGLRSGDKGYPLIIDNEAVQTITAPLQGDAIIERTEADGNALVYEVE